MSDTEKKKILIIEDDLDVAKLLAVRLKNEGYSVFIAADAIQGTKFAHVENPDLIILDLKLPGGSGIGVLNNLNMSAYLQGTPVIVLTGLKDDEYKKKVMEKGVAGYFEKPYDAQALLEFIKGVFIGKQEGQIDKSDNSAG